ncbi:MAG: NrdJb [Gammaproteobacteria bacterium]|nr:NrdJb [Gammaproteobacteria bacterium]MCY4256666.1 NrdJb [Gammaproteobacteria bacterium]
MTETAKKIAAKIVGYRVEQPTAATEAAAPAAEPAPAAADAGRSPALQKAMPSRPASDDGKVVRMHEGLERPERLEGTTYKVKTPVSDHAMYVTINDIVLNEGTADERRRPFEIFINSKNLDHYQWIVALTRVMSAVFRKGGDVAFLVDELKAVFDPRGGYWQAGGVYMPSIIAELGCVVGEHLENIGFLGEHSLSLAERRALDAKRQDYEDAQRQEDAFAKSPFPAGAQLCGRCHTTAVVMMDGCLTCLNCGDSKCN